MDESLTQRRRVWEEGLRVVNHCGKGIKKWRYLTRKHLLTTCQKPR